MSDDARHQLEAAARHIFADREPCEYDFMRTVPSWHRTPPLPRRCRLHGLPVPKGRISTCGQECADATARLVFWGSMCYAAWERDQHRCRECGKELQSCGSGSYHHVVEVNEGGGQLGLDNIHTLCRPCHASVTAEYAALRAERRRLEARAESPQLELLEAT